MKRKHPPHPPSSSAKKRKEGNGERNGLFKKKEKKIKRNVWRRQSWGARTTKHVLLLSDDCDGLRSGAHSQMVAGTGFECCWIYVFNFARFGVETALKSDTFRPFKWDSASSVFPPLRCLLAAALPGEQRCKHAGQSCFKWATLNWHLSILEMFSSSKGHSVSQTNVDYSRLHLLPWVNSKQFFLLIILEKDAVHF